MKVVRGGALALNSRRLAGIRQARPSWRQIVIGLTLEGTSSRIGDMTERIRKRLHNANENALQI